MQTINIHEAKTTLSAVLAKIEETGEGVTICRYGKPVADLVPHRRRNRTVPHALLRKVAVHFDLTEPMTESDWDL